MRGITYRGNVAALKYFARRSKRRLKKLIVSK
jgi:hypothetical protein